MNSHYISTITPPIPSWQKPIETSSVEEFCGFMLLVLKSVDDGYPGIGIVYSDRAGIGKTTAILAAAETAVPLSHNGRPSTLLLELEPDITQMAFLELILNVLDEKPRGRTKSHLLWRAIEAIKRNDIRLIVFDEADQFSRKTFELLRFICGKTSCPMVLVGLKKILSVIKPYEQLESRSFLTHRFNPIDDVEVLSIFLPGLIFPRWSFNPDNPEHIRMGKHIWDKVQPSLRLVRGVVQKASNVAEFIGAESVTKEHVDEALKHVRLSGLHAEIRPDTPNPQRGSHEDLSEERHRVKEHKLGNKE